MNTVFFQNGLRIWKSIYDGSLNFAVAKRDDKGNIDTRNTTEKDLFSFMMPYIYELAYYEANGKPFSSAYFDAVYLKESIENWLESCIGYAEMSLTEARFVLESLYLPSTAFSSI